jgi:hypothetical protein
MLSFVSAGPGSVRICSLRLVAIATNTSLAEGLGRESGSESEDSAGHLQVPA